MKKKVYITIDEDSIKWITTEIKNFDSNGTTITVKSLLNKEQ